MGIEDCKIDISDLRVVSVTKYQIFESMHLIFYMIRRIQFLTTHQGICQEGKKLSVLHEFRNKM